MSRGELSGTLDVSNGVRNLYKGRFNASSLTTRNATAKYLLARSDYPGWPEILERFCWHVLTMAEQGPAEETIGDQPEQDELPYLLWPLLPEGTPAMLYGPPAVFKSTLAALVACSVETGVPLIPGWRPQRAKVLVLDWEASHREWNGRVIRLARGAGLVSPSIAYRHCGAPLADLVEPIAAQVARQSIGLVIVDSMGPAQGAGGDGDPRDSASRVFEALRAIGATSLLIDQVTGDGLNNEKGSPRPYGSVHKVYETRSMFEVRAESQPEYPEARQLVLTHRKFNEGPLLAPIGLRVVHGETATTVERCEITADDLEKHALGTAARVRRLLGDEGAMSRQAIVEALGINRGHLRVLLNRGKQNGLVKLDRDRVGLSVT